MKEDGAQPSILDNMRIATPCPKNWEDMALTKEDAVRFCGECKKNVYNVAQLSTAEAELLLQKACASSAAGKGSICMQIYRRADGTVVTDDCPVGLRRVRDVWRRFKTTAAAVAAVLLATPAAIAGNTNAQDAQKALKAAGNQARDLGESVPSTPTTPTNPVFQNRGLRGDVDVSQIGKMPPGAAGGISPVNDWESMAAQYPEIKGAQAKIKPLQCKANRSQEETLQLAKLHFELAKLADKRNVPIYAQGHYLQAQNLIADKKANAKLYREILVERRKNDVKLGGHNTATIDKELK